MKTVIFIFVVGIFAGGLAQADVLAQADLKFQKAPSHFQIEIDFDAHPIKEKLLDVMKEMKSHKMRWGKFTDGRQSMLASDPRSGYARCFNYKEIDESVVCVFSSQELMYQVCGRNILLDSDHVASDKSFLYSERYKYLIQGLHMSADALLIKGRGLRDPAIHDGNISLSPLFIPEFLNVVLTNELYFSDEVSVPLAKKGYEMIALHDHVIPEAALTYLSHELYHTQIFRDARYGQALVEFWESLPLDEQQRITKTFARLGVEDKGDMLNEFQAYVLQAHGDEMPMTAELAKKYHDALRKKILSAGVKLFELDASVP